MLQKKSASKKPGSLSYDLQNLINLKDSISIFIINNFILGQNISAIYKEFSNQDFQSQSVSYKQSAKNQGPKSTQNCCNVKGCVTTTIFVPFLANSTRKETCKQMSIFGKLFDKFLCIGKSLSEALLFAEHEENMLCTKIVLNVRNNFCTQHVLPKFELGIFMD